MVASSGSITNGKNNCFKINSAPSSYSEVVTVSGLRNSDNLTLSEGAAGPARLNRTDVRKPDLVTTGDGILGNVYVNGQNLYLIATGTSISAAITIGGTALLWSALSEFKNQVNATQRLLFITAAPKINSRCDSEPRWPNNEFGYGLVDVEAAYVAARENTSPAKVSLNVILDGNGQPILTVIPKEGGREMMLVFLKIHPENVIPGPTVTTIHDSNLTYPLEFGSDGFAELRVTAMASGISSHIQCWYSENHDEQFSEMTRGESNKGAEMTRGKSNTGTFSRKVKKYRKQIQEIVQRKNCVNVSVEGKMDKKSTKVMKKPKRGMKNEGKMGKKN